MRKKKVVFHSDFALSKTGFGRNARAILSYLFKTGKYEVISISGGVSENHPELERTPWRSIGVVPVKGAARADYESNPEKKRMYAYGAYTVDSIIEEEEPDIYIGAQDFWGVDYSIGKPWFQKISSAIWTTLDSLPLLQKAVDAAPKIKNYWIWADFATKKMHELGHTHVQTVRGSVDSKFFKPLDRELKLKLREKSSIDKNDFIIGFVFRNQLRKTVPKLLSGFKIFKEKNPLSSPKLLLHTGWHEGWNIPSLCKERGVDIKDILTTYICKICGNYKVLPFSGPEIQCPYCQTNGSFVTTNTTIGVKEHQLNEIYNLMDVYCHPFTSGGQEIPIQEAKLAGLITLVTNYSCGEDMCVPEAHSLALEWDEYSEFGTQFIKASTSEDSIAKNLQIVYSMPTKERQELALKGRQWVLENFSVEVVGKQLEDFIDSSPFADYSNLNAEGPKANPFAVIQNVSSDMAWVKSLYKQVLARDVPDNDEGLIHWLQKIKMGMSRTTIENYFKNVARQEIASSTSTNQKSLFSDSEPQERVLVKIDSSQDNIFLGVKIIGGIRKKYPDKKLYVFTNKDAAQILIGNKDIDHALVQGKEFKDPQFIKDNFYECYSLDDFSIASNHSTYLK